MQIETKKAIARNIATHIVKTHGDDPENLTIYEVVADELPGLDATEAAHIERLVFGYIEVAEVYVGIDEYRVDDEGNVKPLLELQDGEKVLASKF